MKISLPYRQASVEVCIPNEKIAAVLEPNKVSAGADAVSAVRNVLASPSAGPDFNSFLSGKGPLLVVINDATRPTPTPAVLSAITDQLDGAGAEFIIATGTHRAPTDEELKFIFGENLERFSSRISVHNGRSSGTYCLGSTSRGTEVHLNTRVRDAERILIIGSVEPHYFAGWTGGRKGLVPGLAAFGTIEQNHAHAMSPRARSLALDGNPVHEDMAEACGMLDKNIFTIMTVLDCNQELYAVTAGGLEKAFREAVKFAAEVYVRPLDTKAELVIACTKFPMDIDFYQSHKAIEHAKLALKPGGTLILVSSCRDGVGGDTFVSLLASCETAKDVYTKIAGGYRLGYHKAAKIAELCTNAKVFAYTDLDDDVFRDIFIKPAADLQKTIDDALIAPGAKAVIMPDAGLTVPLI